jgi:hypothetical protein
LAGVIRADNAARQTINRHPMDQDNLREFNHPRRRFAGQSSS